MRKQYAIDIDAGATDLLRKLNIYRGEVDIDAVVAKAWVRTLSTRIWMTMFQTFCWSKRMSEPSPSIASITQIVSDLLWRTSAGIYICTPRVAIASGSTRICSSAIAAQVAGINLPRFRRISLQPGY